MARASQNTDRELDLVVFGASGDTGVIGCCYLFFQGRRLGLRSWAPAGRNANKLKKELMERFASAEPGADGLLPSEPIIADSGDYESLVKMCARTKCVLACAGPFSLYGEGVVRACVEAGTHYVDVTGEIPWVEKMQHLYGQDAEKKGIAVVSCAGYDSVPPDLCTYLAAKALEKEGEQLKRFEAFVGGGGGAVPSGTIDTVLGGVDEGKQQILRIATFGCLGSKPRAQKKPTTSTASAHKKSTFVPQAEQSNLMKNMFWTMLPGYSQLAGQICLPHFMAAINVHAVHHTAAHEGYSGLVYRERMGGLPNGPLSLYGLIPTLTCSLGFLFGGLLVPLPGFSTVAKKLRDILNTPLQQRVRDLAFSSYQPTGRTTVQGYGMSENGRQVNVKMHSEYDPGLGFTMLSACTIAAQIVHRSGDADSKITAGFSSAVVALGGESLADALRASGVIIEVSTVSQS